MRKSISDIFLSRCQRDENGRHVGGTDKQSNHNYGPAYEKLFPVEMRNDVRLVMEVGITDGSSMLAWREIFQNATIVGLDIEPCACERSDRLEFHQGDQRSQADCERAANGNQPGRQFDIIIEDAYHTVTHSLLTLFWLWPFVKPGGMYVIEEFEGIGGSRKNVEALFPNAKIVDTQGPFGGIEPIVVLRKTYEYS